MDLGTLLHHVDHHMYPTCAHFLTDVALIPQAWMQFYQVIAIGYLAVSLTSTLLAVTDLDRQAGAQRHTRRQTRGLHTYVHMHCIAFFQR